MTEERPTHSAPRGIVIGIAIMIVFYALLWLTIRTFWPSHPPRCEAPAAQEQKACNPGDARDCRCPPDPQK